MNQDSGLNILVVEDNVELRRKIVQILSVFHEVVEVGSIAEAIAAVERVSFDAVFLDKVLPDGNGRSIIRTLREALPEAIIIVMTADDPGDARACLELGANDYVIKSESTASHLLVRLKVVGASVANMRQYARAAESIRRGFRHEIIGSSRAVEQLRRQIAETKGRLANILITGETGTGKELVARRLNAIESNIKRPLVAINCAALPGEVESELFGHKKGAFTDAREDRAGAFELANGGDIFFDEIGDLAPQVQAKLLRVLQEGEVVRLGDRQDRPRLVEFRVISATHRPLEEMRRAGTFREDLYQRIGAIRIRVPALREHLEDIPELASYYAPCENGRKVEFTDSAIRLLQSYEWPGNVREFAHCIKAATWRASDRGQSTVDDRDIAFDDPGRLSPIQTGRLSLPVPMKLDELSPKGFREFIQHAEREYFRIALKLHSGGAEKAAEAIGVSRSTVYTKLRQLGLSSSGDDNMKTELSH